MRGKIDDESDGYGNGDCVVGETVTTWGSVLQWLMQGVVYGTGRNMTLPELHSAQAARRRFTVHNTKVVNDCVGRHQRDPEGVNREQTLVLGQAQSLFFL